MPASVYKIDFSKSLDRSGDSTRLHLARSKVVSLAHETPVLSWHHNIATPPSFQRHEAINGALLALALNLAGLFLIHGFMQNESIIQTESEPIHVSWITAPQPKAENIPVAPPKQQEQTAQLKPKPKSVKRVKTTPKTLLSTTAKSATIAEAPASKPTANASQTAASPALAPNSLQPLTLPNLNADYLDNPAPRYPEDARERGAQGKVLVRALINTDGTVAELTLKKSSGHPSLDQSALKTVKNWRFVPAQRSNSAVSAWVIVSISFSLEG